MNVRFWGLGSRLPTLGIAFGRVGKRLWGLLLCYWDRGLKATAIHSAEWLDQGGGEIHFFGLGLL